MKKVFDIKSSGFMYSILVLALTVGASLGIKWGETPGQLATDIISGFTTGGIISLAGLLLVSVVYPIYNVIKQGQKITLANIFDSVTNWIAFGNAIVAALLLFGVAIPNGTVEGIVNAIGAHDWGTLFSLFIANILNPIIRAIKQKNLAVTTNNLKRRAA